MPSEIVISTWPAWDTVAFLWVNSHHMNVLDVVMAFASGKFEWVPLYIFLLFLLFRQYGLKGFAFLLSVACCVVLTDQVSVHLFKEVFQRLRPCHEPSLDGLVRILEGHCGGKFGFVSSHAANTGGVAVFLSLLFRKKWMSTLLISWVILVSYSRIYLGVHYPLDVIVGGILGAGMGAAVWVLTLQFSNLLKGWLKQ